MNINLVPKTQLEWWELQTLGSWKIPKSFRFLQTVWFSTFIHRTQLKSLKRSLKPTFSTLLRVPCLPSTFNQNPSLFAHCPSAVHFVQKFLLLVMIYTSPDPRLIEFFKLTCPYLWMTLVFQTSIQVMYSSFSHLHLHSPDVHLHPCYVCSPW